MNIIRLETLDGSSILINLDNTSCIRERRSNFGENFTEITLSHGKPVDVKETLEHIQLRLGVSN
jgi:hypothetical protein